MEPPILGWQKLNFDGTARRDKVVVSGVIRPTNRDLVITFTSNLNGYTNNKAKGMTL